MDHSADQPARSRRRARFLAERGLKAERMPMTVLLQEPVLPEKLSPSQRGALDEVLEAVSVWVITTG